MKEKTLNTLIGEIPAWKRWLICHVAERKNWKIARSYNVVAKHIAEYGSGLTKDFEDMKARGDKVWAEVYAPYHGEIRYIHKQNNRLCFRQSFKSNQTS
jgi:hypothetical protein